jgi:hypothetical protein
MVDELDRGLGAQIFPSVGGQGGREVDGILGAKGLFPNMISRKLSPQHILKIPRYKS